MGLLSDFKAAAVARGRYPDDQLLTPAAIFPLVRDLPYERASDLRPATTIAEWQATAPASTCCCRRCTRSSGSPRC